MRSKHLLLFFITIVWLSACKGGKNKFTVSGEIGNMPEQTVYLEELSIDAIIIVDSTTSDSRGNFELAGHTTTEPSLYRLRFENDQAKYVLLSLDKGTTRISGNWNTIENYNVSGSASSASLKGFLITVREHLRDFNTMSVVMDTLKARGNDSMLAEAMGNLQQMSIQFTRYIEQYADTTTYLPNALFAVQMLNAQAEKDYLAVFVQGMNTRFPNSTLAKQFTTKYSALVAQMESQQAAATAGPAVGNAAPDISLPTPDGATVSLSSLKGKYVLVDFWASWCRPCRQENPNVVAAYNKYKGKNFTILGVSLDDDKGKWMDAIKEDGLTWAHISDLKGWESIAARNYAVQAIPTNFLVDPNGIIIARDLRAEALEAKLAEVLK